MSTFPPPPSEGLPLQALLPEELALAAKIDLGAARKIVSLVHRTGALPDRSPATIPRIALDAARKLGSIPSLEIIETLASAVDPFVKLALRASKGEVIETVRIPLEKAGRYSVCVSSQVGCALACAFCATGKLGLVRNLESWEIVEQVRLVARGLATAPSPDTRPTSAASNSADPPGPRPRVHGVVFQGMGEPLANFDRVAQAIRVISEPSALAVDQRNITVCTAGLPHGIRRLARELPRVRLGLSLGDVRPGRRASLMPIERSHPLDEVLDAVGEHARASGHAPMWAYTLLAGINDGDDAARALAMKVRSFAETHGVRPRLSLIPYNAIEGASFVRQTSERLTSFRDALRHAGVAAILRYSGGGDVGAACGQLAGASRRPSSRPLQLDSPPVRS